MQRILLAPALMVLAWTVILAGLFTWNARNQQGHMGALAERQARAFFRQIVATRAWNAEHGGVYVVVTDQDKPNPYLKDDPLRDLETVQGVSLTKINPAYMTRQVGEIAAQEQGVHFHITSLDPLRPDNAPDPWEAEALHGFRQDSAERFGLVRADQGALFRYMAPLEAKPMCLSCHPGSRAGDIRGGISVSFDAAPFLEQNRSHLATMGAAYGVIWVLGLVGIGGSTLQINRKRGQAEEANRLKSLFLANMSHDMRTPMNGILGLNELMLRQRLSPQQQRYAELIRHSARSLLEIINDILDFSKLEAGKLRLEERDFDLREMVEGLRRVVAFECERKGLELRCEVREDLPRRLRGDDFRLRQVLSNLLGNAVKFTDHGSVVLRVERDPEERAAAGRVVLRFIVADTGGGIPRDKLERIFESFTQLDSSPAKRHEGSGLGLAISRQLAVMLGGDIRVRSEPGRGSEFTLRARLRTAESAQERPAEDTRARTCREGRGLRVLLAEDNTVNRTFMHDVLATAGHSVVSAGDGQAVLNALRGQRFDVVLMDVQMPGMDGLEATRRIRGGQERGVDPHVPVVAVTAFALESDRERIMAAGMDGYLAKPLGADELLRAVCDAAQGRQAEQAVPAPETAAPTDEPGAVLDRAGALQRCNGNRRLLAKLERVFVEDAPAACEELEQALEQGDLSRARGLAHALKNSAGMVGAVVLQDAARAVEAAARQGDTAGARACREPLAAALARTMERIGIDPEEC